MVTAPAGRQAEWERLQTRLKARKPALLLIAGPAGSGRTTLLTAAAAAGRELGYSVVGDRDPITVDEKVRPSDLRRIVTSVLDTTAGAPIKSQQATPGLRNLIARLFGSASDDRIILRLLEAQAPTILLIDGFAPSSKFSTWFANRLLPRLLRSKVPVLVLVTENLESMTRLLDVATETVELHPIGRDAIEEHLQAAGAGLQPPLSDSELAAYRDAVVRDLSLLTPLEKVLSVLKPET